MMLEISRTLLEEIRALAAAEPGREVCGLLFGDEDRITAYDPADNVAEAPERTFEIDPRALFAALRAERQGGPRLVGHYHSHPSGDVTPSACDAAMAEPGRLWLIVSGGDARLWQAGSTGALHGRFSPVTFKTCDP
ncbi:Mov34/MPN/PAD-1 family protein [Flavisphingomonas formosensis]|uniref:Mov34/MPN/PAD-1 family protein n=1 Tax=Flavisphingomonas formosensis TaxID=861534 RepID=UPI0012FC5FA1|nr:M67 family metallopeptidase [Sphingomonas formosensis]